MDKWDLSKKSIKVKFGDCHHGPVWRWVSWRVEQWVSPSPYQRSNCLAVSYVVRHDLVTLTSYDLENEILAESLKVPGQEIVQW